MQIAIVRHAIAESRKRGRPDRERALTAEGRKKMIAAARGLSSWIESFDLVATSPYTRARQTAEILSEAYRGLSVVSWRELEPEVDPEDVLVKIDQSRDCRRIALVTHQPLAGRLVSWFVGQRKEPFLELKKGSVCLLESPGPPRPGGAELIASIPPGLLRRIRR